MSRFLLLICLSVSPFLPANSQAAGTPAAEPADTPLITVQKRRDIHVVYEVKVDEWTAGIGRGLYYVRGLLEAYKSQGVSLKELHISVVLHGSPVSWALNQGAYQDYKGDPFANNPNEQVIEELLDHGVSVETCNVTMKAFGWTGADMLPGVRVVHDGYTRIIDLQQRGYAYIRF